MGAYPGTRDVSTPRELENHVEYGVPSPVVGQCQRGDTASRSQESEAVRGSSGASGRGRVVYRGSAAEGVVGAGVRGHLQEGQAGRREQMST